MSTDNPALDHAISSITCAACGCTSPLARQFRKAGSAGVLCPRCYVGRAAAQQRNLTIIVALAFGGLALFTLVAGWAGRAPPFALGNVLLGVFAVYVSIIGHELTHALAGWLTGGRVLELRLGAGPDRLTLRLSELWVRVRRYLVGGACLVVYPPGRQQRWRMVILYAAGLLFHLLVIAVLLPGFPHEDLFTMWAGRDSLLIANVMLLALVLLTREALTQDGLVIADAAQIKQLLTAPHKTYTAVGWIMPLLMVGLLLRLIFQPTFSKDGPIFFSKSGPGSLHARC